MSKKNQEEKKTQEQEISYEKTVNSIDDNEMKALLSDLVESKYWKAILRYNRVIDAETLNGLASLDPFKEPTLVARSQGVRMGLYYLEQTAMREYNERKEESEVQK